jgi:hypothetical protein
VNPPGKELDNGESLGNLGAACRSLIALFAICVAMPASGAGAKNQPLADRSLAPDARADLREKATLPEEKVRLVHGSSPILITPASRSYGFGANAEWTQLMAG